MGTRVYLAVADRVSDAEWREIYDRARRVANQWEPRPLSKSWRQIGSVQVGQYCLDLEVPEGLHIVGDAATLMTAESFVFPASLERFRPERGRKNPPPSSEGDVLVEVARWIDSEATPRMRWCDLLGEKTQGLPYHSLIVALGLLVEHSLPPGTAIVYGDISTRDGEHARRGVASILGEDVERPAVTDELAFMYAAVCMDTRFLYVHLAVRALIENRALRRL